MHNRPRVTIGELEDLLKREDDIPVTVNPDGSIKAHGPKSTTIFWSPAGPLLRFSCGILYVEDLNPQIETKWRMSRADMLKTGLNFIKAALLG